MQATVVKVVAELALLAIREISASRPPLSLPPPAWVTPVEAPRSPGIRAFIIEINVNFGR